MKTIITVLFAALVSLMSVGCSNISPVAVSTDSREKTAKITFQVNKIASLGKVAADIIPAKIIFSVRPWNNADNLLLDTIPVSGTGSLDTYISGFQKATMYTFQARVYSSSDIELNYGTPTSVEVGSADTFAVNLNLIAAKEEFKVKVPIQGTPVAASACSVLVKWTIVAGGAPMTYSKVFNFLPGTLDTARVDELISIAANSPTFITNCSVEITIYLNNNLGFYKGTGAVNITPSSNASLIIPLTKYGGGGSLAKMVIFINALGQFDVSVTFS